MASPIAIKRLRREVVALEKEPIQDAIARPLESNILEWHFLLRGSKVLTSTSQLVTSFHLFISPSLPPTLHPLFDRFTFSHLSDIFASSLSLRHFICLPFTFTSSHLHIFFIYSPRHSPIRTRTPTMTAVTITARSCSLATIQ